MTKSTAVQKEREVQDRVVKLFQEKLGYEYLGNWENRKNSNIEEELLKKWLSNKYAPNVVKKAIFELKRVAGDQSKSLYDVNKSVYSLLRYGVNVQPAVHKNSITVWLIDWKNPQENHFGIAEEVSIEGQTGTKRPDLVLYVNGIALGVLELKRSTVSIAEGIRQNLTNQDRLFIRSFFSTIQFVMAGSDVEGIAYGTIETKAKYFLKWKEISKETGKEFPYLLKLNKEIREKTAKYKSQLEKNIIELLTKERFLEFIHDFIVFDRGMKKLCRHNQYFGVKAAQNFIKQNKGGIIWHTQGSGKSLTMVWLTKWIRGYNPNARVLIITDREELDEQIEKVYRGVEENIYRTQSGKDLLEKLNDTTPWLMCSLIHKFGRRGGDEATAQDVEEYIQEIQQNLPENFQPQGDIYVFVDECHRTQSGVLHKAMKEILPNALFIGFTGTPILKSDKQTTMEIFGKFIHTYKFNEAVADNVVLDLRYEARNVDQFITSEEKIDQWFDIKTKGLTEQAKSKLQNRWGTLRTIFSSRNRLEKIVGDILLDMETKPRLQNGRGNAILIADSIYNACRYYDLFHRAGFTKCAIITSYVPNPNDIAGDPETPTERAKQFKVYQKMIANYFNCQEGEALNKIEQFENEVKKKFIEEPAQMKLLIVVNKLLTGFDAPPATYLYIDRHLQDHGLFQAVCRVNRLDGEDKDYGYIIDYRDLFQSLNQALKDYTSILFEGYDKQDVEGLLKEFLESARTKLTNALEAIRSLVEPVPQPKKETEYIKYFCGDPENPEDLQETEPRRKAFYKCVSQLTYAYSIIANHLKDVGFEPTEIEKIRAEVKQFEELRRVVQISSGDFIDWKEYDARMRYLIDTYIGAKESQVIGSLDNFGLVKLLVQNKKEDLLETLGENEEAIAEIIENNLRKIITEERQTNPAYYEKMSELLNQLIQKRREKVIEYQAYLQEVQKLSEQIQNPSASNQYPVLIDTPAKRALYDKLDRNENLVLEMDKSIRETIQYDWRNNIIKQRQVEEVIYKILKQHNIQDQNKSKEIFELVKNQKEY